MQLDYSNGVLDTKKWPLNSQSIEFKADYQEKYLSTIIKLINELLFLGGPVHWIVFTAFNNKK